MNASEFGNSSGYEQLRGQNRVPQSLRASSSRTRNPAESPWVFCSPPNMCEMLEHGPSFAAMRTSMPNDDDITRWGHKEACV